MQYMLAIVYRCFGTAYQFYLCELLDLGNGQLSSLEILARYC